MDHLLLSVASPESLSWAGFVVLISAMLGEVAVNLINEPERPGLHAFAVFTFAALAVAGYAIERVGDDVIVKGLETRAHTAEAELRKITTPRTITNPQLRSLAACLKEGPKGAVYVRPALVDADATALGKKIQSALDVAGFPKPPLWSGDGAITWSLPGTFLIMRDVKHPPPQARRVQECLMSIGIRAPAYDDGSHKEPPGTISIGIGARF